MLSGPLELFILDADELSVSSSQYYPTRWILQCDRAQEAVDSSVANRRCERLRRSRVWSSVVLSCGHRDSSGNTTKEDAPRHLRGCANNTTVLESVGFGPPQGDGEGTTNSLQHFHSFVRRCGAHQPRHKAQVLRVAN